MIRPSLRKEGDRYELEVSSSLVKKMYFKNNIREDFCNLNFWWCDLRKKCPSIPSESMLKGLYFETAILGSTAGGDMVTDLPRHKKTGDKLTDHVRIDELIAMWDFYAEQHNVIVVKEGEGKNTQKRFRIKLDMPEIAKRWPQLDLYLKMDVDLISSIIDDEGISCDMAVIDLKLTQSHDNTFGEYAWGEPERIDHLQAYFYSFFLDLPFYYVVAQYKDPKYKIFPVNTNRNSTVEMISHEAAMRHAETIRRITDCVDSVMERETKGEKILIGNKPVSVQWLYQWPSRDKCKTCPFTHKCKSAKQFKSI
jgi:hypothetical protein